MGLAEDTIKLAKIFSFIERMSINKDETIKSIMGDSNIHSRDEAVIAYNKIISNASMDYQSTIIKLSKQLNLDISHQLIDELSPGGWESEPPKQ